MCLLRDVTFDSFREGKKEAETKDALLWTYV